MAYGHGMRRKVGPSNCCNNYTWNNGCPENYLCDNNCQCRPGGGGGYDTRAGVGPRRKKCPHAAGEPSDYGDGYYMWTHMGASCNSVGDCPNWTGNLEVRCDGGCCIQIQEGGASHLYECIPQPPPCMDELYSWHQSSTIWNCFDIWWKTNMPPDWPIEDSPIAHCVKCASSGGDSDCNICEDYFN